MFFLDDFLFDIDDLLHQLHFFERMDFLEPTHFLVTDIRLQRLWLRLMHILNRSELLNFILQRLWKLDASGIHLNSRTLDGFTLWMHWRLTAKVLSIRTIVLLCCDLSLSASCCIFYFRVWRYRHLLNFFLLSVLLAPVLEAVGKLLYRIKKTILEAFLILTRNGLGRCLFR